MKDLGYIQSESDIKVKEDMKNGVTDIINERTDIQIESRESKSPKTKTYCLLCQEFGHVINEDCVVNATCLSCGVDGHVRRDCYCLLCQEYGHVLNDDCTTCFSCGIKGHVRRDCPSPQVKNEQIEDTGLPQPSSLQTQELNPECETPDDQNMESPGSLNSVNISPRNENINHLIDLLKGQEIHYKILNHYARIENQRGKNNAWSTVIIFLKDQRHIFKPGHSKINIGKKEKFPHRIAVPIFLATGNGENGGHYILFKSQLTETCDVICTTIVDTLPVNDSNKIIYETMASTLRNQLLDLAAKYNLKISLGEHEIDTSFQQRNTEDNGMYALIGARNVARAGQGRFKDSTGKLRKRYKEPKWPMEHDTTHIRLRVALQLIANGLVNDAVNGEEELLEEEIKKCRAKVYITRKPKKQLM